MIKALFSFGGVIGRGSYFKYSLLLFMLTLTLTLIFGATVDAEALAEEDVVLEDLGVSLSMIVGFSFTVLASLWATLALDIKRLRDAGMPLFLVVLAFFVGPVLTLILCFVPSKDPS